MGIDHNKRLKEHLYYYSARISRDISNLIKWLFLAVITGCIVGAASTLFSFTLKAVTSYRKAHEWIFLLLPLSGLVIVFLYEKLGKEDGGTNQVLSTVRSRDDVPILSAPLIFITTALTHLTGGSAGREGAAIQLGGSIANQLGRWIHLDEEDRHVIVMCGMSAAFSALFGTPMAAAVFALEVVSVGVMYYAALMPCMIASLIASGFAAGMGVTPESFHVTDIPALTVETGLKMGVIALGCAVVSIMFCIALNGAAGLYGRWFKNKYVRVAVGACLVIVVTFILRTDEYMGAGAELIEKRWKTDRRILLPFLENGAYSTDYARRIPRGRDRTFFLHWSYLWLCDGKSYGNFSVDLCSLRNGSSFLRCDQLSDHFDPDRF